MKLDLNLVNNNIINGLYFIHNRDCSDFTDDCALHKHEYYEIFYLISGSISYTIEENVYSLSPGELIVVRDDELHSCAVLNGSKYESLEIRFHPKVMEMFNPPAFNLLNCFRHRQKGAKNKIDLKLSESEEVFNLLRNIEKLCNNTPFCVDFLKLSSLITLLVSINTAYLYSISSEDDTQLPATLANIIDYINSNFHTDCSLEFLEERFFINKFYLCRMFKKHLNISVHDYITFKRISKARELLSNGVSTKNTARLCGFNNYSNFVKIFKNTVGTLPSKYTNLKQDHSLLKDNTHRNFSGLALPDLVVSEILWSPSEPFEGDQITFSAIIKNEGTGPTPAGIVLGVSFLIWNEWEYTEDTRGATWSRGASHIFWSDYFTNSIEPGESITLKTSGGWDNISSWTAVPGIHRVMAYVNDIFRIKEYNYENNRRIKLIKVESKSCICK